MSKKSNRRPKQDFRSPFWPVLTEYSGEHLDRILLPLGGIGTGTVSLGGRGQWVDWEVGNRPAKGFVPSNTFFAIYAKPAGKPAVTRALEGVLLPDFEGARGARQPNAGLPRFRNCKFLAAYPLGQVLLSDPDVPVDVRIEAFNPLVPGDSDKSGIPLIGIRFVIRNRTGTKLDAAICGNIFNFIGTDGTRGTAAGNKNVFRSTGDGSYRGISFLPGMRDELNEFYGSMALVTDARETSYRTNWTSLIWNAATLDFWDDFSDDGILEDRSDVGDASPIGSVAGKISLSANEERSITFLLTWHFPNRKNWFPSDSITSKEKRIRTKLIDTFEISDFFDTDNDLSSLLEVVEFSRSLRFSIRKFSHEFCSLRDEIVARGNKAGAVIYRSVIESLEPMPLVFHFGYDGPVKVFIDGDEVFYDPTGTNPSDPGDAAIFFHSPVGEHEITIILSTNHGSACGIWLRMERLGISKSQVEAKSFSLPVLRTSIPDEAESGVKSGAKTACCDGGKCPDTPPDWVGNYYCGTYRDAWDVVEKVAPEFAELEKDTVAFLKDFCSSDLPDVVKEAALYNLSTLRSQTSFRIAGGQLCGWEGCDDTAGCCQGSCTHVWNYENAVPYFFGSLSRSMRELEFAYATDQQGMMSFRVYLPLRNAQEWRYAAADGQMGSLIRLYRDWKLSGDHEFLISLWPHARRALEFCWIPGGWDADKDGVMEGCQHNTMDVEYYGPNPQMEMWYLGALRACEEMAIYLGEKEFAETCRNLFERGSAWTDSNLFNGEYYEHHLQVPDKPEDIAPVLFVGLGSTTNFQLGNGCLVDQLVGQNMAHAVGLGYLIKPVHAKKTLRSIMKYNFRENFFGHFNHMRSYALNDESALLMASYPHGVRPQFPFPYFTEVMTGFEYAAAVHMLQEGLEADGLKCIQAIRSRYDGRRRSPFDEAECGHHYARTLASWGAVLALTGFQYSAVDHSLTLNGAPGNYFWSHGAGWGTCDIKKSGKKTNVTLRVTRGELKLRSLSLIALGKKTWNEEILITEGNSQKLSFSVTGQSMK